VVAMAKRSLTGDGVGGDHRRGDMGPIERAAHDVSSERMDAAIAAIHRGLMERATGGRLTWVGDEIVSTNRKARPT